MIDTVGQRMSLRELLHDMGDTVSLPALDVSGVCLDSRQANAGDLYLAVGGEATHGLRYVADALTRNIAAVAAPVGDIDAFAEARAALAAADVPLIEIPELKALVGRIAARFYGEPSEQLHVVAVTGTDGKTSVCRFIANALDSLGQRCGYIGTLGWGFANDLADTQLTTPDAVSLQRMLATLLTHGADAVALEASSHGINERRLDELSIDVAVLTNFGRDHLDYHQSLDDYRAAKARLFHWPTLSSIVVNGDDELGWELARKAEHKSQELALPRGVVFHAGHEDATESSVSAAPTTAAQVRGMLTVRAENAVLSASGLLFELVDGEHRYQQTSRLLGRFNIDNLLACHGVLRVLGHAANDASAAINEVEPVPGRMERFAAPAKPTVVVDYAHTPQALTAALAAARHHCQGNLWVVFGCGGDRDPGKRAPMGSAAEIADRIVVTDDNPRTEPSADILEQILAGMQNPARAEVIANRREAIHYALTTAAADDLVLVAGKGHENYQIVGTERLDYSDRETVGQLLRVAS